MGFDPDFPFMPVPKNPYEQRAHKPAAPDIEAQALRDALAVWHQKHVFEPGQIVRLKPGLGRYRRPPNGLWIIGEIFEQPIFDETASEMEGRIEPLHGWVMCRTETGTAAQMLVCLAFFEPVPESDLQGPKNEND